MKDIELLDIVAMLSLYYQIDSNVQLRSQSTNDDILMEIKEFASELTRQNDKIIELLEGIRNDLKKDV